MSNWLYAQDMPTNPWRSAMTVPRRVFLKRIGDSIELCQLPVDQLAGYRSQEKVLEFESLPDNFAAESLTQTRAGELRLDIQRGDVTQIEVELLNLSYLVDFANQTLTLTRGPGQVDFHETFPLQTEIPIRLKQDRLQATFVYDESSVELFTDEGAVSVTTRTFPTGRPRTRIRAIGGKTGPAILRSWRIEL